MTETFTQFAFAIFEGGGIRGLAHVGAYKALDNRGVSLIGVAGTSAGAIVAALIAAGARPDSLFRPGPSRNDILQRADLNPIDFFGKADDWSIFRSFRRSVCWVTSVGFLPGFLLALWRRYRWGVGRLFLRFGLFKTQPFVAAFNLLLKYVLGDKVTLPPDGKVRFRHLDPVSNPATRYLKIIATDITRNEVVVFGFHETPDVVVSEAVAASICIPFFFRPAKVPSCLDRPDHLFVDGGMVANLPVWAFAEEKSYFERRLNSTIPILAFKLGDVELSPVERSSCEVMRGASGRLLPPKLRTWCRKYFSLHIDDIQVQPPITFIEYLRKVAYTSVFGGQSVPERFVDDLHVITLYPGIRTLDFDCDWPTASHAYQAGFDDANERLERGFTLSEGIVRPALAALHEKISNALNTEGHFSHLQGARIRLCIVQPKSPFTFGISHHYGFEGCADDKLTIDLESPAAPYAFRTKAVTYVDFQQPGTTVNDTLMTKYERVLVWPELRSVISIPIPNSNAVPQNATGLTDVIGVLCIDSDQPLLAAYQDNQFLTWIFKEVAITISSALGRFADY